MLTLLLLRHAKAQPLGRGQDFDRALTDRGKADAARIGAWLKRCGHEPSLALVSTAARTRQTFDIVAAHLASAHLAPAFPVRYDDALFSAAPGQLRDALATVEPTVRCLLLVGHNPAVSELALALSGDADRADIERMRNRFPPCSLAVLTFEAAEWTDARRGRLQAFVTPEDLSRQ